MMWCCRAQNLRKQRPSAEGETSSDKLRAGRAGAKGRIVVVGRWLAARLRSRRQWI